jgi:hypothetical protein
MGFLGRNEDDPVQVPSVKWVGRHRFKWHPIGFWYNVEGATVLVFPPHQLDRKGWNIFIPETKENEHLDVNLNVDDVLRFAVDIVERHEKSSIQTLKHDFDDPG